MSDYIPITLNIAGRPYKLRAERNEEEAVRKAAKEIDGLLSQYAENAKHSDKQDLLAMAALHFATMGIRIMNESQFITNSLKPTLTHIDTVLNEALKD